jgi:GT2 family glycosyltransferase
VPADVFEVIVVCDGDVDGSVASCRALLPEVPYALRVFVQTNQGPAAARNRGVAEAQAPLIVFVDDDVVPDEGLIAAHLHAQAGQERLVTIGPLLPPPDVRLNPWGAWEERTLCRQYAAMTAGHWQATYRQFYTGNAAVLKRHIVAAGGFDASFRRAEDVELALRLRDRGLRFVFLPQARGWHYVSRTFASWLRLPAAYGAADVAMARAGRPALLAIVAREYRGRRWAVRALTRFCAGRPAAAHLAVMLLGLLARAARVLPAEPVGNVACSLIFNLLYYDGLVNALGSRSAFAALLRGQE